NFLLDGKPIPVVSSRSVVKTAEATFPGQQVDRTETIQPSLFDVPAIREVPPPNYLSKAIKSFMISELKPYSEYKDSGLPWLGQVPAHWDIRRMKLLLQEIDARSTSGKEQLLKVSQY